MVAKLTPAILQAPSQKTIVNAFSTLDPGMLNPGAVEPSAIT